MFYYGLLFQLLALPVTTPGNMHGTCGLWKLWRLKSVIYSATDVMLPHPFQFNWHLMPTSTGVGSTLHVQIHYEWLTDCCDWCRTCVDCLMLSQARVLREVYHLTHAMAGQGGCRPPINQSITHMIWLIDTHPFQFNIHLNFQCLRYGEWALLVSYLASGVWRQT